MRSKITLSLLALAGLAMAQNPMQVTPLQVIDGRTGAAKACSGCQIFTYLAGTNTPSATYTDYTVATPNTNPVLTNSSGYAVAGDGTTITGIWPANTRCYKFVLKDDQSVTIWTQDHVCSAQQIVLALLSASSGSSLIGFQQAGGIATTLQAHGREAPYSDEYTGLSTAYSNLPAAGYLTISGTVTGPVTLSGTNQTIFCEPGASIRATSNTAPITVTGTGITISGCTIDGRKSQSSFTDDCLAVTGATNFTLKNSIITNCGHYGVFVSASSTGTQIINNTFPTGAPFDTVLVTSSTDTKVNGNDFTACGLGALNGDCISGATTITNMQANGNRIHSFSRLGIEMNGTAMVNCQMDGNTILNTPGQGLQALSISGCTGGSASNNIVSSGATLGMLELAYSTRIVATGNQFSNTDATGVPIAIQQLTKSVVGNFSITGVGSGGFGLSITNTVNGSGALYDHVDDNVIGPGTIQTTGTGVPIFIQSNNSHVGATMARNILTGITMNTAGAYCAWFKGDTSTFDSWSIQGLVMNGCTLGYKSTGNNVQNSLFSGTIFTGVTTDSNVSQAAVDANTFIEPQMGLIGNAAVKITLLTPYLTYSGNAILAGAANLDWKGFATLDGSGNYSAAWPSGHTYSSNSGTGCVVTYVGGSVGTLPLAANPSTTNLVIKGDAGKVVHYQCTLTAY